VRFGWVGGGWVGGGWVGGGFVGVGFGGGCGGWVYEMFDYM